MANEYPKSQTYDGMDAQSEQDIYLARQAILNRKSEIVAHELLFRHANVEESVIQDDLSATSAVIINMLSEFGLQNVIPNEFAFINVSASMLMNSMIEILPSNKIVIEILEDVPINDLIINRIADLKNIGFMIALDDFEFNQNNQKIIPLADIIKLDIRLTPLHQIESIANKIKKQNPSVKLLAEKIETAKEFDHCQQLGFELYQGHYFFKPVILHTKKVNPSKRVLLRIMGDLLNNSDINKIEEHFKGSPELSVSLLKLVNSVALSRVHHINTLRKALIILGKTQINQWIQLMLYSNQNQDGAGTIFRHVASRAMFMELVSQKSTRKNIDGDISFVVGMLSMSDAVISLPLHQVLNEVGVSHEIYQAIINRAGDVGELLTFAESIEIGNFPLAHRLANEFGISPSDINEIQLKSMQWAWESARVGA